MMSVAFRRCWHNILEIEFFVHIAFRDEEEGAVIECIVPRCGFCKGVPQARLVNMSFVDCPIHVFQPSISWVSSDKQYQTIEALETSTNSSQVSRSIPPHSEVLHSRTNTLLPCHLHQRPTNHQVHQSHADTLVYDIAPAKPPTHLILRLRLRFLLLPPLRRNARASFYD